MQKELDPDLCISTLNGANRCGFPLHPESKWSTSNRAKRLIRSHLAETHGAQKNTSCMGIPLFEVSATNAKG